MKKVIVIGGGAAGMMAACMAAVEGAHVTLLEKNEKTGKKIYITGKGRCNLTNACQREEFLENVITNPKFLYSAFAQLDNQAVMNFFEKAGCRLKTERGDRVFPVSDHSSDVIATLNGELKKNRVQVMLHTEVSELLLEEGSIKGVLLSDGKKLHADAVIIATGGRSYESTGSTGDGYRFAKQAGHTIKDLRPSLVPFVVKEEWCKKLQGLSLKNVAVPVV